jgi:hypothetical protein
VTCLINSSSRSLPTKGPGEYDHLPSRDKAAVNNLLILKALATYIGSGACNTVLLNETGMSKKTLFNRFKLDLLPNGYAIRDVNSIYHLTPKGVEYRNQERRCFLGSEKAINDARDWPNIIIPGTNERATLVFPRTWSALDISEKASAQGQNHGYIFF